MSFIKINYLAFKLSKSGAPGVSTSSVALANGINANLLRRWVLESGERGPVRDQLAESGSIAHEPGFAQLASDVGGMAEVAYKIPLLGTLPVKFRSLIKASSIEASLPNTSDKPPPLKSTSIWVDTSA